MRKYEQPIQGHGNENNIILQTTNTKLATVNSTNQTEQCKNSFKHECEKHTNNFKMDSECSEVENINKLNTCLMSKIVDKIDEIDHKLK